jgi:hypothetical protein
VTQFLRPLRPYGNQALLPKITESFMSLEGVGYDFNPHNTNINYSMLRFPSGELGTVRVRLPIPSSRRNLLKNTHKVLRFIYFIILQRS